MMSGEEEKQLAQALAMSKKITKREYAMLPDCPTYYPSEEEFRNPLAFIQRSVMGTRAPCRRPPPAAPAAPPVAPGTCIGAVDPIPSACDSSRCR